MSVAKIRAGLVLALLLTGAAQAATYQLDAVLSGGGGFGASLFHSASSGNAMSGDILADIPSTSQNVSGTYDSSTGAFFARLPVSPRDGSNTTTEFFTLQGNLLFDANNTNNVEFLLAASSTLTLTFEDPFGPFQNTVLGFQAGYVCCGSNGNDPNSFRAGSGDSMIMTLWGANGTNFDGSAQSPFTGSYTDATLGMDLRLELTPVPLPAAAWLFASAVLGLVVVGRRRRLSPILREAVGTR